MKFDPQFSQQEWAQAGKALLCLSGVACLALASDLGPAGMKVFLRVWVGGLGALAVLVSLRAGRAGKT